MTASILAGRWGQRRYPAGGASQRIPEVEIYNQNLPSRHFKYYLAGGEVGNLQTGSLEFEVLEPDLLE